MGLSHTEKQKQIDSGDMIFGKKNHRPIPIHVVNKIMNSLCKIIIKMERGIVRGNGFFMNISQSLKYLITNYHIINPTTINEDIELFLLNQKMKLNINNRDIKYFDKKDITIIEIKMNDKIFKDIYFLDYDDYYIDKGYEIYLDLDIFSIQDPFEIDTTCACAKIRRINGFEFEHDMQTASGTSGCPLLVLNNNITLVKVIGIHSSTTNYCSKGIFVGEIIKEFNNKVKEESNNKIISIRFSSNFQKINYSISCKILDNFIELEKKLFQKYPELKSQNASYTINGKTIKKYDTLDKNGIKNGDLIKININKKSDNENEDKIIAIRFITGDQNINFPIPCKTSDILGQVAEKLFIEYPEIRNKNIYYLAKGKILDKEITLEKNGIENGDAILLNYI